MSQTNISKTHVASRKVYSDYLGAQALTTPTPLKSLAGPMPRASNQREIQRMQTTSYMPIVEIEDLASTAGDRVQIDFINAGKPKVIMGDRNAEGQGMSLDFVTKDVNIDMATLPYSAGGKMTQKRTPHNLRMASINHLATHMPLLRFQRCLTHMAGARGSMDGTEWILPLASDVDFPEMMVNPVQAPTWNRHFVVNGSALERNASLASIDTNDALGLDHLDALSAIVDELPIKMLPLRIPGDELALEDPIKGLIMLDPLVYDKLITSNASGNLRQYQQNAMQRAQYAAVQKHPLFSPGTILWNGFLVKKMYHSIRFAQGSSVNIVAVGDRLTGTESAVTIPALAAGQMVARSLVLAGQGLVSALGANAQSEGSYTLLENRTNFGRNLELAGEFIAGESKVRIKMTNELGLMEMTDYGIAVIDSVVTPRIV